MSALDNNSQTSQKNQGNCGISRRKHSNIQFTRITDPFNLVKDPDLIGNSLVYATKSALYVEAVQETFMVQTDKRAKPVRVKTSTCKRPGSDDFPSMIGLSFRYNMFQIMECGKSSIRKDIVAVDIDEDYDFPTILETLRMINDLPECLLTQNSITGHWQIQFYLKEPVYTRYLTFSTNENGKRTPVILHDEGLQYEYMKCIKRMARYFKDLFPETDMNYQGVMCRNPYSPMQSVSVILKDKVIYRLRERRPSGVGFNTLISFLDKSNVTLRKNINLSVPEVEVEGVEYSRHKTEMEYARRYMWSNMRNGDVPSEDDLAVYMLGCKEEIAFKCCKEPHSDNEILSQIHSWWTWCTDNFREVRNGSRQWKSSVLWNNNQRANKIKKAKQFKKVFMKMTAEGKTMKEIALELKISRVTLYSYLGIFFVMDTIKTRFVNKNAPRTFGILKSWDEIISEISDKIKELMLRFGDSKIKWKSLNYKRTVEDYELSVYYDMPIDGNRYIELAA